MAVGGGGGGGSLPEHPDELFDQSSESVGLSLQRESWEQSLTRVRFYLAFST